MSSGESTDRSSAAQLLSRADSQLFRMESFFNLTSAMLILFLMLLAVVQVGGRKFYNFPIQMVFLYKNGMSMDRPRVAISCDTKALYLPDIIHFLLDISKHLPALLDACRPSFPAFSRIIHLKHCAKCCLVMNFCQS